MRPRNPFSVKAHAKVNNSQDEKATFLELSPLNMTPENTTNIDNTTCVPFCQASSDSVPNGLEKLHLF